MMLAAMLLVPALLVSQARSGEPGADLISLIEEESTVESASRHPQSLTDAPANVTIITREEIEDFGYESLGEAIASAAGFYLRDDLNYHNLGIRGLAPFGDYGSHVMVMVDGHPMVEPIFSSSFFERNQPVDLRYVQRIEIVRGPGSALYGTNAVLAVVNVVTAKATESGAFSFGGAARSNGGGDVFASVGQVGASGWQAGLSGTVSRDEGFDYHFAEFDDPSTNFGRADDLDDERTWNLHGHVRHYGWWLSGLVASREKQIPTASWGAPFGDDRLKTTDIVGFVDARYDRPLGVATHVSGRLTFDWYSYKGVWPFLDEGDTTVVEDPHESEVLGGEVLLSSQALEGNYAVAGLAIKRVVSAKLQARLVEPDYEQYVDLEKTDQVFSAFAQDEVSPWGGPLAVILGVRYDDYKSLEGVLNPRLGLILKSRAGATKLLYGKSFRAPTLYERYYDDGGDDCSEGEARANPDLDPERADTYEIVHEAELGHATRATVSAFYYEIEDLIIEEATEEGCLTSVNSGAYRSQGIEATIGGTLRPGLRWSVAYSHTDARNKVTEERLPVSPEDLVTAQLVAPLASPRTSLGITVKYVGEHLGKSDNDLEPVLVTNATLHVKKIAGALSVSLSGKNIFNENYFESAGPEHEQETLPQGKRVFVLKAGWGL
jgi:outer membrane receptor for ferrienterochelin and colicins